MLRRRLDRSGVEAGGEAGGEQNAPRTQGGVGQTQRGGVGQTGPSIFRRCCSGFSS